MNDLYRDKEIRDIDHGQFKKDCGSQLEETIMLVWETNFLRQST